VARIARLRQGIEMNRLLRSRCHAYALAVGSLGMLPLGWAAWTLVVHPPPATWYMLAGLALLSGALCIRIPSMQATISVSEGFIFTAALLFGPAAATVIVAIDGAVVSLSGRGRSAIRVLFGIGEPAISVCLASMLFYGLAGVAPLWHHTMPFGPLVLPLVAMTLTYFALNTVLAGTAVWLDTGGDPAVMLRQHAPQVALDFSVSLGLAAALVQTNGNLTLSALVILVPMLLSSYISSHHTAARLEDTNRHLAELRRLYNSTVKTLAMAVDAKDQVTHGHIRRVQLLSTRLAVAMGADARELQALEAAALLHDLGKLAIPEHILNKPGRLTPGEYEEIKKHADIGASILSAVDFPFPVVPIVRHHHENWDGSGYPHGLSGTAIPLGARILSVVDCYDALTSDRPYRRRMNTDEALDIIQSRSGRMYDPSVIRTFLELHAAGEMNTEDPGDEDASPLRARIQKLFEVAPVAPVRALPKPTCQDSVAQFVATLGGLDYPDVAHAISAFVSASVPDSVAVLFRPDSATHELVTLGLHRGFDARIPPRITIGAGVSGWVAATRQPMVNADAELDLGHIAGITVPPLRMCVSVPIADPEELLGVLTVYSPYAFSETHQMLIHALAEQLPSVVGLDRASMLEAQSSWPRR
jgi:putative nucleotidyltransferase with HDIG domain